MSDATRGGERHRGRRAEPLADVGQPQVVGAEVVAPLREAMRLVDRQPGHADLGDGVEEPGAREPLRRDVDQPGLAVADAAERGGDRVLRHRRGEHLDAVDAAVSKRAVLILHEGDERRDDQRHTRRDERGQLVAERLSRSGRHDGEHVAAVQERLDGLALARPETGVSEEPPQVGGDVSLDHAHGWSLSDAPDCAAR
jgi:hypothetical protein